VFECDVTYVLNVKKVFCPRLESQTRKDKHNKMQGLYKFRALPGSFVRTFSMGKPEPIESWYGVIIEEKKTSNIAPAKFTKAFQEYLDSRLTYEKMMDQSDAEKKKLFPKLE